jgi:hypothetical protein
MNRFERISSTISASKIANKYLRAFGGLDFAVLPEEPMSNFMDA